MNLTSQTICDCIDVLEALVAQPTLLAMVDRETRQRLVMAAGRVSRPNRDELREVSRAVDRKLRGQRRVADEAQLRRAGIRQKRLAPVFVTPDPVTLAACEGGRFLAASAPEAGGPGASAASEVSGRVEHDPAKLAGAQRAGTPHDPERDPTVLGGARDDTAELEGTERDPAVLEGAQPGHGALAAPALHTPRACYICKVRCQSVHFFYDQMCGPCGDFNYAKRSQTADLRGRVALISGARVKIGYQAAILLLRAGCRVIVSTRFPRDAAARYSREVDYADWKDRLHVYGLDLRHTPSVEAFARHLGQRLDRLDFVLHNACQTVRRPVGFYRHLMQGELGPESALPDAARPLLAEYEEMRRAEPGAAAQPALAPSALAGVFAAPALSQVPLAPEDFEATPQLFPDGLLDADLQQVDRRGVNSWRLALDQVGTVELLEVQLVNAIAPFVLNARLRALMTRARTFDKHIVNVSAMEGQFYRRFKTDKHPHTNMAKAALNMMTRTSAPDYRNDGIFMNSVDTGWVTDEDPAHIAERKTRETGFHPPLDIVDGAARIVDPIFDGINTGQHVWGQFLKDYRPTAW
jgi:NAD(P)-dependent dehydrogenase (short-subunit alcohol dehydrogenase family)